MHWSPFWNFDLTRSLTRRKLATVLADLKGKVERQAHVRRNLVIVPLACRTRLHSDSSSDTMVKG